MQAAEDKLGSIDYLVLNHILNIDMGQWRGSSLNLTLLQSILDVNFKAYVHLASYALPALEKSSGSIIIMSSLAGELIPKRAILLDQIIGCKSEMITEDRNT